VLVGAALGSAPASASVSFDRTDVPLPGAPDSVALGDLDGHDGADIAIAFPALGSVGVMLNQGDGTFGPLQQYTAGPHCAGTAVDADTLDLLALVHRPDGSPVPLLLLQHAVGSFGRQLCLSYELDPNQLACDTPSVQGPLAVGDLNGVQAGVPPDEIVTYEGGDKLGFFGFAKVPNLVWADTTRDVPGDPAGQPGLESATLGDLDDDGDLDVLVGKPVNSLSDRVQSIHYFIWGAGGLEQTARTLPSIAGLDAVAIADVDGDGCNDVVGAGDYGRGAIHLGLGGGSFDGGRDLAQLGYANPATATRVTMAVGDLSADGRPELVIADARAHAVMVFRNASTASGGACFVAPVVPPPVVVPPPGDTHTPLGTGPTGVVLPAAAPPAPPVARSCETPGTSPFTIGTTGADVLVGGPGRDVLNGRAGDDCVFGLANDDRLIGGSGDDLLSGGSGDDRMTGDAGADRLTGGSGNDTITPGSGKDKVTGGNGNDIVSARDGARDTIDCGGGHDVVTADRVDSAKGNCEKVTRR
jgi:Ca2+-binding RTX toxin-like protein